MASKNVDLSLKHIKRYLEAFDQLPQGAKTADMKKKKENAEAALDYLTYFFDSKVGDVATLGICGPRPQIPEIP